MLIVLSPAKRLDWTAEIPADATRPAFEKEAMSLARTAKRLSVRDLQDLMKISEPLARLNRDRFQAFTNDAAEDDVKPAVHAFAGDTYLGLEAATLSKDDLRWAGDHLRILSGLYGLLRPHDLIRAYRLEMGSR